MAKLRQAFSAERASRDLMDKRKTKEIELVETGLHTQFENELHIRQDMVTRLQKTGDEKLFNVKAELAKQTQGRE